VRRPDLVTARTSSPTTPASNRWRQGRSRPRQSYGRPGGCDPGYRTPWPDRQGGKR